MSQPAGISVVLTTRDRSESLKQTLTAFGALHPPRSAWELIVVDNGSRDGTQHVVEAFTSRLPICYAREPTPGQCAARNTGIAQSRYELIVFTDDDITPFPDWLAAYDAMYRACPECGYFGGPIEIDVSACRVPAWSRDANGQLKSWVAAQLAALELENDPSPQQWFYGGNMAYRRALLDEAGRFDMRLGHRPGRPFGGEEILLQLRLRALGHKPCYVPGARVAHRIQQDELTIRNRVRRTYFSARGMASAFWIAGADSRINRSRTWQHVLTTARDVRKLVSAGQADRIKIIIDAAYNWGYEAQMLFHLGQRR